jgi:hypothetical protein
VIARPSRSILALALALAGCADLLGFDDYSAPGSGSGGTGGAATTTSSTP